MKRLRRIILNGLTMLSLLLCVATVVLWLRSYRVIQKWLLNDGQYISLTGQFFRTPLCPQYALLSEAGRLTLLRPPVSQPVPPDITASAIDLAARLRNEDVEFRARFARNIPVDGEYPTYFTGAAHVTLASPNLRDRLEYSQPLRARLVPLLLQALDRPRSFVAAHVLLTSLPSGGYYTSPWIEDADVAWLTNTKPSVPRHSSRGVFHGLRIAVDERPDETARIVYAWGVLPCTVRIDSAQFPRIRENWHRSLDVPVASAAWKYILIASLLLPALRLALAVKRQFKRASANRRNLCATCNYDLRATPDRCPECGTVPAKPNA